jgi:hypothetical protein
LKGPTGEPDKRRRFSKDDAVEEAGQEARAVRPQGTHGTAGMARPPNPAARRGQGQPGKPWAPKSSRKVAKRAGLKQRPDAGFGWLEKLAGTD